MSYHKVNYQANGVDFADYFPAYEVGTATITTISENAQFQIPLTKNKYNTTNYVSFIQVYQSGGTANVHTLSTNINQFTIYNKTASSYYVWMNCASNIVTGVSIVLWCVTFYMQQTERSLAASIPNYSVNGVSYNPSSYFPQFAVIQNAITTASATGVSTVNLLSTKNSSSTEYCNFGSVTNNSVSTTNAGNVQKIVYYEFGKVPNNYTIHLYTTNSTSVTLNTITMYVPAIPSNNFATNYKVDNVALEDVFPICEVVNVTIYGSADNRIWDVPLTRNTNSSTNYVVITSFTYTSNTSGSGGTYSSYQASNSAGMPIVSSKTPTQFRLSLYTTSGNNWSGSLNCLVIYK